MDNPEVAKALGEGFARGLITGASISLIVVCGVFYLIWLWVKYPNNVRLIFAQMWSGLTFILGSYAERRYLVNFIEGKIGASIEALNRDVEGLDAELIKITLVRNAQKEAFIEGRVLIMRLQRKENHGENLANIAMLYSQHLYSKVDPHLNILQREAMKIFTAKSVLTFSGTDGIREFNDLFYRPLVTKHKNIQPLLDKLEVIDNRGLFYSVFIQEMVYLGNKVLFRPRAKGVSDEVEKFITFLSDIAKRKRGDDTVKMDFRSANIKVSFVYVAKKVKRDAEETQGYVSRVQRLPRDTESYYMMGWGENLPFVRRVADATAAQVGYLHIAREKEYDRYMEDGKRLDAICILARNNRVANFEEAVPQVALPNQTATSAAKAPSLHLHKK